MKKIICLLFCVFFAQNLQAQDEQKINNAKNFIQDIGNKIINIANEKNLNEEKKREKIISVIDQSIDSQWIGRFVLGKNYKLANDEQKEKFADLYRQFMINTYGPKFKNYNGRKFSASSASEQNGFIIVKAEFLPKDSNVAINTDFRVKERDGKLVILDFVAEGISLIETQRSEFNSAIAQKGIDGFLTDLSKRVEALKSKK